jgi:hypothetical protein
LINNFVIDMARFTSGELVILEPGEFEPNISDDGND